MKITPLEIRQKSFEKAFRGYLKEDVDAFLQSLSAEWERMQEQQKELKYRFETAEKEVQKLREVENSLFKTLKTAEDTGSSMVEQARKNAELILREAQMKSESLLNDSKREAKDILENADEIAKNSIYDVEHHMKELISEIRQLENYRDNLVDEIKSFVSDTLERVNRTANKTRDKDFKMPTGELKINSYRDRERKPGREAIEKVIVEENTPRPEEVPDEKPKVVEFEITPPAAPVEAAPEQEPEVQPSLFNRVPESKKPEEGSFFDSL